MEEPRQLRAPARLRRGGGSRGGAFGALAGAWLVAKVPGLGGGLPRFSAVGADGIEYLALIPLAVAGWLLAMLFHLSNKALSSAAKASGSKAGYLPVLCGIILGVIALFLPDVLFAGEEQGIEIMDTWTSVSAVVLILTGVVKVVATPLCVNFGWRGGNFFPLIFAGISFGYGVAALTGLDPVLCVLSVTTALVAGMTRRPLLTLALLLLCFPLRNVVLIAVVAIAGSLLPMPASIAPDNFLKRRAKARQAKAAQAEAGAEKTAEAEPGAGTRPTKAKPEDRK